MIGLPPKKWRCKKCDNVWNIEEKLKVVDIEWNVKVSKIWGGWERYGRACIFCLGTPTWEKLKVVDIGWIVKVSKLWGGGERYGRACISGISRLWLGGRGLMASWHKKVKVENIRREIGEKYWMKKWKWQSYDGMRRHYRGLSWREGRADGGLTQKQHVVTDPLVGGIMSVPCYSLVITK